MPEPLLHSIEAGKPGVPRASVPPQFCSKCGAQWNQLWTECAGCAALSRSRPRAVPGRHVQLDASIKSPLALYFALLLVSAAAIIGIRAGANSEHAVIAAECADAVVVIAWCALDRKDVVPLLKAFPRPHWYGIAAGAALGTFAVATLAVTFVQWMLSSPQTSSDPFLGHQLGLAAILTTAIQPAIVEELAFRGVILAGLQRVLESNEAILVSAGMFMILHLSVLSFPHLFLIGAVLGYLRVKTGSLYPGMLLHFTHNFLCLLLEHHSL